MGEGIPVILVIVVVVKSMMGTVRWEASARAWVWPPGLL